jgi:hypothetical protein
MAEKREQAPAVHMHTSNHFMLGYFKIARDCYFGV